MVASVLIAGCATSPKAPPAGEKEASSAAAEANAGVKVVSLRRTAEGRMIDFRFRVVDPERAAPVLLRSTPAYLVHQATGARMGVPETRMGRMRQSTLNPEQGRIYFIMFYAGRQVAPGDKVTVVVGEHRFENLTVR